MTEMCKRPSATPANDALQPNYGPRDGHQEGMLRKTWDQLSDIARASWERNPTVRAYHGRRVDPAEPRG
jgi:hypothetical protein